MPDTHSPSVTSVVTVETFVRSFAALTLIRNVERVVPASLEKCLDLDAFAYDFVHLPIRLGVVVSPCLDSDRTMCASGIMTTIRAFTRSPRASRPTCVLPRTSGTVCASTQTLPCACTHESIGDAASVCAVQPRALGERRRHPPPGGVCAKRWGPAAGGVCMGTSLSLFWLLVPACRGSGSGTVTLCGGGFFVFWVERMMDGVVGGGVSPGVSGNHKGGTPPVDLIGDQIMGGVDGVRDALIEAAPRHAPLILARDQVGEAWCRERGKSKDDLTFAEVLAIWASPEWRAAR